MYLLASCKKIIPSIKIFSLTVEVKLEPFQYYYLHLNNPHLNNLLLQTNKLIVYIQVTTISYFLQKR